ALQVLKAMARSGGDLQGLRSGMSKFPQVLVNVRFTANEDPVQDAEVLASVAEAERELAGRGRVLLRKSGTEPLIRVMVEGEVEEQVIRLANRIADQVKRVK
ncbi:MAG: phosphoglucosamine mutase, partial [Aeromonadaceae bacterium]